jgi:hypothetical protein
VARGLVVVVFLLVLLAGSGIDIAVKGRVRSWHMGHVLNPFFTIGTGKGDDAMAVVLFCALAVVGVNLLSIVRGVGEVLVASRDRSRRAA